MEGSCEFFTSPTIFVTADLVSPTACAMSFCLCPASASLLMLGFVWFKLPSFF
jgi:hypothetical protein